MSSSKDRFVDDECESKKMLEVALPELYKINSFRILGLPVSATLRELDKQQKKIALLVKLGTQNLTVNSGYLPIAPSPSGEMIKKAMQRIFDPENRLIDELFWFWPIEDQNVLNDQALKLLISHDLNGARSVWKQLIQDKKVGYIALHNLAILHHIKALDIELESIKQNSQSELKTDQLWQEALHWWFLLSENEQLWQHLLKRSIALDDPRISAATVSQMRIAFPKVITAISVYMDLKAARSGKGYQARRHRVFLIESGFDQKIYFNILEDELCKSIEQIKMICERNNSEAKSDPDKAAEMAERIYSESLSKLNEINSILDREHYLRKKANNIVAQTIRDCSLIFWKKTENLNRCLRLTDFARNLSMDDGLREKLNKDLEFLKEKQKAEKEYAELKNNIEKDFVFDVRLDSTKFMYPIYCTCCLKETLKKQEIKLHDGSVPFPICEDCLNHQNEYQSKGALIIFLSSIVSIAGIAILNNNNILVNSHNWFSSIPFSILIVLLFSSIIRLRKLKEGHACRAKAVEIKIKTGGITTYSFHHPLYARSFANGNNAKCLRRSQKKPTRGTFILSGKNGSLILLISVIIYSIFVFSLFEINGSFEKTESITKSNTSSSPNHYVQTNNVKVESLEERINKGKAQILLQENDLKQMDEERKSLSIKIENYKNEIDIFELAVSQGRSINQYQYQEIIDEHNNLVEQHNSLLVDIETKNNIYKAKLESVNEMVDRFNKGER
jgi:hypothetical protein